jgi:hypothetical protein
LGRAGQRAARYGDLFRFSVDRADDSFRAPRPRLTLRGISFGDVGLTDDDDLLGRYRLAISGDKAARDHAVTHRNFRQRSFHGL